MIAIGLMYLILLQGKLYTNETQSNEMLGLCFVLKYNLCAKMMFSVLLRLQIVNVFVPGCTGWLHQMGLIFVTIKLFILMLQQPILIRWD